MTLAEKISISRHTLLNWGSNIIALDIKQAKIIAKIFNISLDDLTNNKTEIECSRNKMILSKFDKQKNVI